MDSDRRQRDPWVRDLLHRARYCTWSQTKNPSQPRTLPGRQARRRPAARTALRRGRRKCRDARSPRATLARPGAPAEPPARISPRTRRRQDGRSRSTSPPIAAAKPRQVRVREIGDQQQPTVLGDGPPNMEGWTAGCGWLFRVQPLEQPVDERRLSGNELRAPPQGRTSRPDPPGTRPCGPSRAYSIAKVLLLIEPASRSTSAAHADTSLPLFCFTDPELDELPGGGAVPVSSSNSRSADARGSSSSPYSPLGIDHAPSSFLAQNGPPGCTSRTSGEAPVSR